MSKTYRAGNGQFVRRDNPVAVIQRLRAAREAERILAAESARQNRLREARRNGYRGPLTRADLTDH
jgi:hypothetical protein